MGKVTGFMEFERLEQAHEPVAQRKTHFREFITPLSQQEAKQQAARCMDCGTPFCTFSCPLHNVAPEFNDLVYNEDWEKAYLVLSSTNNFPEFTSRVCPALCENGCIMNYTQRAMGVKSIERAIITNAWNQGWVKPEPPKEHKDKSVAVVGSGPSGLACAQQLARMGYAVTVFEKNKRHKTITLSNPALIAVCTDGKRRRAVPLLYFYRHQRSSARNLERQRTCDRCVRASSRFLCRRAGSGL